MKKHLLILISMTLALPAQAWLDPKPAVSFPKVDAPRFIQKRVKTASRQASEFHLKVDPAPIAYVKRHELTPMVQKEIAQKEMPLLEPLPNGDIFEEITAKNVKSEFEKTVIAENKYISLMEDPNPEIEEFDSFFEEDGLDESELETMPAEELEEVSVEESEDDFDFETVFDEPINDPIEEVIQEPAPMIQQPMTLSQEVDAFAEASVPVDAVESANDLEVLQMKVNFAPKATSLSAKNVHLISSFAQVVQNNPLNAVEISISKDTLMNPKKKKRAAKRFAIVSRVLKDYGLSPDRIQPVLTPREENSFALKIVNKEHQKAMIIQDNDLRDLIRSRSIPVQTW